MDQVRLTFDTGLFKNMAKMCSDGTQADGKGLADFIYMLSVDHQIGDARFSGCQLEDLLQDLGIDRDVLVGTDNEKDDRRDVLMVAGHFRHDDALIQLIERLRQFNRLCGIRFALATVAGSHPGQGECLEMSEQRRCGLQEATCDEIDGGHQ